MFFPITGRKHREEKKYGRAALVLGTTVTIFSRLVLQAAEHLFQ